MKKIGFSRVLIGSTVTVALLLGTTLNVFAVPGRLNYDTTDKAYTEQEEEKPDYDTLAEMYDEKEAELPDYDALVEMYDMKVVELPDYDTLMKMYEEQLAGLPDYDTLVEMYAEKDEELPDYDTLVKRYLEQTSELPDYYTLVEMYSEQAEKTPDYNELESRYSELVDTGFEDVPADSWYAEAVKFVTDNQIMYGTSDELFSPFDEVSRAMFVTILYRVSDNKVTTANTSFTDLEEDKYYYIPIKWGYSRGIVDGTSETAFEPNTTITREQLVSLLYRFSRYEDYGNVDIEFDDGIQKFSDFDEISEYSVKPMEWAYTNGFIQGRGNNMINPQSSVTRAETALIIQRYIEKYESEDLK